MSVTGNHTVNVERGLSIDGEAMPEYAAAIVTETRINANITLPANTSAALNGLGGIDISKIASMWMCSRSMDASVVFTMLGGNTPFTLIVELLAGVPWEWDNQSGQTNPLISAGGGNHTSISADPLPAVIVGKRVNSQLTAITATQFVADIELTV